MKTVLKSLTLATALMLALQPVQAQPDPAQRLNHLKEQQTEQVRKILEESRPQRESLRAQKKALHEQTREKLKAVLNPEPLKKFDNIREERRQQRGRRGPRQGGLDSPATSPVIGHGRTALDRRRPRDL